MLLIYKRSYILLLCLSFLTVSQAQSDYILVDQFGYFPEASKVAVIKNPMVGYDATNMYEPGASLEVRQASNDQVVFTGSAVPWNDGNTHTLSGDQGWWFDFSSIQTSGSYYIFDPSTNEKSAEFDINSTVYDEVLKASVKMFYYNRCNSPKLAQHAGANWADGNNFMNDLQDGNARYIYDQSNASLEKDLSGGWFDAGDFNKYVTFTITAIHNLLGAYEQNPNVFGDDWNIPESGNGIPDLLDEVKWELDWLIKMNNADGSTHNKIGSQNYSVNTSTPPSLNTDPRFYGPTCTSSSIAIASMFARAAKVFQSLSGMTTYANELESRAKTSFSYVLPFINNSTLETDCDDGSIISGDADWDVPFQLEQALAAAIYLFDLTNEAEYNNYIINHIGDAEPIQNGFWGPYKVALNDALLLYTIGSNPDASVVSSILSSLGDDSNNNYNGYYGFNDDDLYRSFMPSWSYHWGSSQPKAEYGNLNSLLIQYGINPASHNSYEEKVNEQIHYFHGLNPMGMVYLSNMYDLGAEKSVNEIYHGWFQDGSDYDHALTSPYGPAPGFLSGGANPSFTIGSISPPSGQPAQKSYLDFNDNWPNNSWEISEPAIYYQAAYVRLLSNAIANGQNSTNLPVELLNVKATVLDRNVRIDWATASEVNNDYFQLEYSIDGENFQALEKVAGAGNSIHPRQYNYLHRDAISLGVSLLYYRIKQVDYDGTFEYSQVVNVQVKSGEEFSIFPSITRDGQVKIRGGNVQDVKIYNVGGQLILQLRNNSMSLENHLDLSGFESGFYLLQVNDRENLKLIKE